MLDDILWPAWVWLPNNSTWADLEERNDGFNYPTRATFWYTLVFGVALLGIRILVESFVFLPIGYLLGFVKGPLITRVILHLKGGFAGRSKFKRVAECAWRFTFYTTAWCFGLYVLWTQPQFWDVAECWRGWPAHALDDLVWWYYMVETGFYWGLLFSTVFIDVRRKDFLEMTIHHIITIGLLWISWCMNMIRVGTMVLFVHDSADTMLELGKLFRYANWDRVLSVHFVFFFIAWVATRLVYYPFWLIHSVIFDGPRELQKGYRWENLLQPPIMPRVLMALLSALVFLHILWTVLLMKIAKKAIQESGVDDIREDSDDESDDGDAKKNE